MTDDQMIDRAMKICVDVHSGQRDRYGEIYILHPMRVMMKVNNLRDKCVAILHDVVEDSDWTAEHLSAEGFSPDIVDAVNAITKQDGEDYMDYIHRLESNGMAVRVKLADLEDNLDLLRLKGKLTKTDCKRLALYLRAYTILCKIAGKEP